MDVDEKTACLTGRFFMERRGDADYSFFIEQVLIPKIP